MIGGGNHSCLTRSSRLAFFIRPRVCVPSVEVNAEKCRLHEKTDKCISNKSVYKMMYNSKTRENASFFLPNTLLT